MKKTSKFIWEHIKLYRDLLLWLNTYRYKKWIQYGLRYGFFSREYLSTEEFFRKVLEKLI